MSYKDTEINMYQSEDGRIKIDMRMEDLPSPAEQDYLKSIKQTKKKLKGKTGGERE